MAWIALSEAESRVIRELGSLSDPAVAVVGATIIDQRVSACLVRHLRDLQINSKRGSLSKHMLRPSGALGSFSAKINLAYMMRIYDEPTWRDLDRIREIRNAFAHDLDSLSFEDASVSAQCKNLIHFESSLHERLPPNADLPEGRIGKTTLFIENLRERLSSPRERYILAIMVYAMTLMGSPFAIVQPVAR